MRSIDTKDRTLKRTKMDSSEVFKKMSRGETGWRWWCGVSSFMAETVSMWETKCWLRPGVLIRH